MIQAIGIPTGGLAASPAGTVNWDIDGNGSNDFDLGLFVVYSADVFLTNRNAQVALNDSNNRISKLSAGQAVGTVSDGLGFLGANVALRVVSSGPLLGYNMDSAWSLGDTGYIGFQFDIGGATHYGWASMTLSNTAVQYTINDAWYEDVAGQAVTVGSTVPEPAHIALGLGALALGAAGLRRMRQAAA
ncbi:MAG: Uncharacterised protein [Opitutia bacterium UBA7350]|nr:MAG: Uncharacterised protein [Opitutae bacterium UBA7350]